MAIRTHYDNLKVSRTATKAEIKQAYRKLCHKHHPDKYPEKDREKQNRILQLINTAYKILSDDTERRKHDEWIAHRELCERNAKAAEAEKNSHSQQNARTRAEQEAKAKAEAEQRAKAKAEQEAKARAERERQMRERQRQEQERRNREAREARARAEAQAEQEARERYAQMKAKEKAEKKRRIIIDLCVTAAIFLFAVIMIKVTDKSSPDASVTSRAQTKPPIDNYVYNINKISPLTISYYIENRNSGVLTIDIYYDGHADSFNRQQAKRNLNGILRGTYTCNAISAETPKQIKYIYHFLKGGNRIYMTVPFGYACR